MSDHSPKTKRRKRTATGTQHEHRSDNDAIESSGDDKPKEGAESPEHVTKLPSPVDTRNIAGTGLRMTDETFAVRPDSDQLVAVAGALPAARVTLQLAGPGQVCLDGLDVGSFEPAS